MKNRIIIAMVLAVLAILLFVSGCVPESEPTGDESKQTLIDECETACNAATATGQNLSAGPCLLDPMSNSDWVCDIAHKPREPIDNKAENQCQSFRDGMSSHFIEFTPDCEFIKAL